MLGLLLAGASSAQAHRSKAAKNAQDDPAAGVGPAVGLPSVRKTSAAEARTDARFDRAWKHYQAHEYPQALKILDLLLSGPHPEARFYELKARVFIARKDNRLAIKTATEGLAQFADDAALYDIRGNTLYFEFQPDKALSDYRRMLALEHSNARYYNNALTLMNEQRLDEEMRSVYQTFLQALAAGGMDEAKFISDVHFYAALAYARAGQQPRAIEIMDQAIRAAAKVPAYYSNRGMFRNEIGDYDRALADLDRAIALNPEAAMFYTNRADIQMNRRAYRAAERDLLKALAMGAADEELYANLAQVYLFTERPALAREKFELLMRMDPKNAGIFFNYGYSLLELGEATQARVQFEKGLLLEPREVDGLVGMVLARQLAGDQPGVTEALQKIREQTSFVPDRNLLRVLETQHYHYSEKAHALWEQSLRAAAVQ